MHSRQSSVASPIFSPQHSPSRRSHHPPEAFKAALGAHGSAYPSSSPMQSSTNMAIKSRPRTAASVDIDTASDQVENIAALYRMYSISRIQSSSGFYKNMSSQPSSFSKMPQNALERKHTLSNSTIPDIKEESEESKYSQKPNIFVSKRLTNRISVVQEEASKPDESFPFLTRKVVQRLRLWAARARFEVAMRQHTEDNYVQEGGLRFERDDTADLLYDFMVENHLDEPVDLGNRLGTSWFVVKPSKPVLAPGSIGISSGFGGFSSTMSQLNVNSKPSDDRKEFSRLRKIFEKFSVVARSWFTVALLNFQQLLFQYSFFFTAALLLGVVSLLMYAANVEINAVELWQVFAIAAGGCIGYVPAELIEVFFFWSLSVAANRFRYLRHLEFLLSTLKVKIRIIMIGVAAIVTIKFGTTLLDSETATLCLNVFITTAAVWVVFDILIQSLMHRWNVATHIERMNDILLKETIFRHLCKPDLREIRPEATDEECKAWRTFSFHELSQQSSFFNFNRRLTYLRDSNILVPLRRVNVHAPRNNHLSYAFSQETWITITRKAELEIFAEVLFNSVDKGNFGVITFVEWMDKFQTFRGAALTWTALFGNVRNNLKGVDLTCFKEMFTQVFLQRSDLSATLKDFGNISAVVKRMFQIAFWIFMIIVILLVAGVTPSKVLVTISTLLISGAVAFGNSIKAIFDSIVFILFTKPYDVGDTIILQKATEPSFTVSRISVMTTTFLAGDNKVVIIPNAVLATGPIFNLRKSKEAVISLKFDIAFNTPQEKLQELTENLRQFIVNHRYTRSKFELFISDVENMSKATLSIVFQTVYGWQDGLAIVYIRSNLYLFIQEQIKILGIEPLKQVPLDCKVFQAGEIQSQ
jgi:small-conductance mechanosensitive channel